MEKYNLELWPINENNLNPYLKRTCEILNINNQFRKSSVNEFFNQIEFQYSNVRLSLIHISEPTSTERIADAGMGV